MENMKPVLLLTGGSQGIGRAVVELFLERGWRVALVARDPDGVNRTVEELRAAGHPEDAVCGQVLDVGNLEKVRALPEQLPMLSEGLDALVLNAFYQKIKPAQDFTQEDLEQHWRINNLSPILLMQACISRLQQRSGSIVYVSSIMDTRLQAGYAAYGASKAYMNCFVKQAAQDFGPLGVRINAVSPGPVRTDALERAIDALGSDGRRQLDDMLEKIPMEQRLAEPREVAESVWFAVTGPRAVHGCNLRIDGGLY
jgi:2-hydroxycyclohexanecarboxyl-CoA dehydrogenase